MVWGAFWLGTRTDAPSPVPVASGEFALGGDDADELCARLERLEVFFRGHEEVFTEGWVECKDGAGGFASCAEVMNAQDRWANVSFLTAINQDQVDQAAMEAHRLGADLTAADSACRTSLRPSVNDANQAGKRLASALGNEDAFVAVVWPSGS